MYEVLGIAYATNQPEIEKLPDACPVCESLNIVRDFFDLEGERTPFICCEDCGNVEEGTSFPIQ